MSWMFALCGRTLLVARLALQPPRGRFGLVCAVLAVLGAAECQAKIAIQGVQVGFAGQYKIGYWTPVEVTLGGGDGAAEGDLEIVVPDGNNVPTRVVERGVMVGPNEKKSVRLYVKFGRPHAPISVAMRTSSDEQAISERTFSGDEVPAALPVEQRLVVEMGSPLALGSAARFGDETRAEQTTVAYLDDPAQWPDHWNGYDGVDLVVMTTGRPEIYGRVPAAALEALDRWLHLEGRLLLSVGSRGPTVFGTRAAPGPLARFAPGTFSKMLPLSRFGALENFAGTSERLDALVPAVGGNRPTIDVALLEDVRGRIDAYEGDRPEETPLVVRRAAGFGELIYVAVDLDEPPLARWPARPQFLAALLTSGGANGPIAAESAGQGVHLGFDDLSGQLRSAIDRFEAVRLAPFWLIAGAALGYIGLLFPLDYFLGRRITLGPAWPWFRFAVIVIGVSLGACGLGLRWKGDRLQLNRAELVDIDAESGLTCGSSWSSLFSPASRTYALRLSPNWQGPAAAAREAQLSWFGLPGNGLGGMSPDPRLAELPLFGEPYDVAPDASTIDAAPLAAWSSKCFAGRWTESGVQLVAADLHDDADRQLTGTIRMTGRLGDSQLKLTDCVLFYDRWTYVMHDLSANEPIRVERFEQQTAETYLTQRRIVGDKERSTRYDPAGLDTGRILQMMMFYKTAGGRGYTGLSNRYQHDLDLSDLLALDRAILIGFGPPASTLEVDQEAISESTSAAPLTIYRIVLPVARGKPRG